MSHSAVHCSIHARESKVWIVCASTVIGCMRVYFVVRSGARPSMFDGCNGILTAHLTLQFSLKCCLVFLDGFEIRQPTSSERKREVRYGVVPLVVPYRSISGIVTQDLL